MNDLNVGPIIIGPFDTSQMDAFFAEWEAKEKAHAERIRNIRKGATHPQSEADRLKQHEQALAAIHASSQRYADLEAQLEGKKTKKIVEELGNLQKEKKKINNAMRTDESARNDKATQDLKKSLDEQIGIYSAYVRKREEVNRHGMGSSVGILGTGRNLITGSGIPLSGALGAAGIIGAAGMIGKEAIQFAAEYQTAMTNLSNTTGIEGKALDDLGERLRKTAVLYNTELPQAIGATQEVLRSLGKEFRDNTAATDSATQSVLTLAKAQNMTAEESATLLTGELHQFGLAVGSADQEAASLARIMNVVAAASKQGKAPIGEMSEGMRTAGEMSHALGISLEETATAMVLLNNEEIKGAEAGGKFALLITKMSAGTPIMQHALARLGLTYNDINPEKVGLVKGFQTLHDKLNEVGNPINRMEILTELFGQGARGALKVYEALDKNIGKFDETKKAITGTNTAQEQANKTMETAAERYKHAKVELEEVATSIGMDIIPALATMGTAVHHSIEGWGKLIHLMEKAMNPTLVGQQDNQEKALRGFTALRGDIADRIKSGQLDRQGGFNALRQFIIGSHDELGTPQFNETDKKQITDYVDGVIAETKKIVTEKTKPGKDNNFGADFKKSKKDLALEAFEAEKAANNLLHEQAMNLAYTRFFTRQITEKEWENIKFSEDEKERQRNIEAVYNYYRALGIKDKEKLDAAVKNDKDYQAIIRAGNEAHDKLWQDDLAHWKKIYDDWGKAFAAKLENEEQFRKAEFEANKKWRDLEQKESDKHVEELQKIQAKKIADQEKDLKSITDVFRNAIEKETSQWENSIFGKNGGIMADIGRGLLKIGENRIFEEISKSLSVTSTGVVPNQDKALSDAIQKANSALGGSKKDNEISKIDTASISITTASVSINGTLNSGGGGLSDNSLKANVTDYFSNPGGGVLTDSQKAILNADKTHNGMGTNFIGEHPYAQINEGTGKDSEVQRQYRKYIFKKASEDKTLSDADRQKAYEDSQKEFGGTSGLGLAPNQSQSGYGFHGTDELGEIKYSINKVSQFLDAKSYLTKGKDLFHADEELLHMKPGLGDYDFSTGRISSGLGSGSMPNLSDPNYGKGGINWGNTDIADLWSYKPKQYSFADQTKATAESTGTAKATEAGVTNALTKLGSKAASGSKVGAKDIIGAGLNFIPGIGPILSDIFSAVKIPGLASGGRRPSGPHITGELGPELDDGKGNIYPIGPRRTQYADSRHYQAEPIRGGGGGGGMSNADFSRMHSSLERSNQLAERTIAVLESIESKSGYDPQAASNANFQNRLQRTFGGI
jgi:TP901 family phage tail tape measure protein